MGTDHMLLTGHMQLNKFCPFSIWNSKNYPMPLCMYPTE